MAELNKELLEILTNAGGGVNQLVSLARENGIDVPAGTENDFYEKIMSLKDKMPLSDDELEAVAGGGIVQRVTFDKRIY